MKNSLKTDVSIIIVNYNTCGVLLECIASVYGKTKKVSYEIIVVDNASSDLSSQYIRNKYPQVRLIELDCNLGFGGANNKGVEVATGQVVFFLNPDTILLNDAVSVLYDYINNHRQVGICGANLYTEEQNPNVSYIPFPSYLNELGGVFKFGKAKALNIRKYHNFTVTPKVDAFISGAAMMIRKNDLDRYGSFDPDFFMYYEDTELCYRFMKKGMELHALPSARIIHLQGMAGEAAGGELKLKASRMMLQSRFIYFKKVNGRVAALFLKRMYHLKCFIATVLFGILQNKQRVSYWKSVRSGLKEINL